MRTNLGRVSPLPKGAWAEGTSYTEGDIVRSGSTAYIALKQSKGVQPGESALWGTYWMPLAEDGNQSDIKSLEEALALAEMVLNMDVSIESLPFGEDPSVVTLANQFEKTMSLDFKIPQNSDFAPDPPSTVFFLNAGSWEVKVVTGLGGADYSVESLGVQDFSNVQYSFDEGMTWEQFVSSAYNVVIGGQFGDAGDTMDAGMQATSGRRMFIYAFDGFEGDAGDILIFGNYADSRTDFFERPTSQEIYLDGQLVNISDTIISGAHYTVGP